MKSDLPDKLLGDEELPGVNVLEANSEASFICISVPDYRCTVKGSVYQKMARN